MPNLFTNYLGKTIEALGPRAKALWTTARRGGDFILSNNIARYSTMAAGAGAAYYGYKNNHPLIEMAGMGVLGGVGFGSAHRGYFGASAQGYARKASASMRGAYNRGVDLGSRMRRGTKSSAWAWGDNGASTQKLLAAGTGAPTYAPWDPYYEIKQAAMRGRVDRL